MQFSLVPALAAASCLVCTVARAEQFIVTDVSYTHSAETTMDSHYRVAPLPGTPSNWKSPVDYSAGSVHVLLEVKTKPTDTATQFQICFEGSPGYGCTDQSKPYTKTGTYEWTTKFSSFYLGNGGPDWTKGVSKVALILKDTSNNKPQGDPKYVPTDLRVQVALLSSGATFVAPPPSGQSGGSERDAGAARPAPRDAGSSEDAASGAPLPPRDAGDGTVSKDAGQPGIAPPPRDSGVAKDSGVATTPEPGSHDAGGAAAPKPEKESGCSVGAGPVSSGLPLALALLMPFVTRRRRAAR